MPSNILVEGQEDKDFLTALINKFDQPVPNILVGGGVDKYPGYLQFLNDFASDTEFKPKIIAVFDKDSAGRSKFDSIKKKFYEFIDVKCQYIKRFDGEEFNDIELEDFIYPDLLFEAVNNLLRKKKYKIIKKKDRDKRTLPAYNKKPILDFITEVSRQNNETKNEIDFNNLGMKLLISKTVCDLINKKNIDDLDNKYPKVKEYILNIIISCSS